MEPVAIIGQQFSRVVIPLIDQAEETIEIIVYDWRWYPTVGGSAISQFNSAILAAARRGVQIRCLVNNDGVAERLKSHGIEAKRITSKRVLHTKLLMLDSVKVVIGSHNYTQHGLSMNEEASVFCTMNATDNSFRKYFEALWGV